MPPKPDATIRGDFVREWGKLRDVFFYNKTDTFKQYTHSIFEGGILALSTSKDYFDLQNALIEDIINNAGRIVLCEGFPHIYGSCVMLSVISKSSHPLHIYPRLVERAFNVFRAPVPSLYNESFMLAQDTVDTSWDTTCLAFDLDYGSISERKYNQDLLLREIYVLQRVMRARGATQADQTDCLLCLADENDQLGVHLYFYESVYYPEECMQLAELCRHALQEQYPVPHCGPKPWSDVVDISIYNKTLRMPFLQKAKTCDQHKKPKQGCCYPSGKRYCGRRYWPVGIVKDGTLHEQGWLADVKHFILRKEGTLTSSPSVKPKTMQEIQARWNLYKVNEDIIQRFLTQFGKEDTERLFDELLPHEVRDYLRFALTLASLRGRKGLVKTQCRFQSNDPIPNYPRPWKDFFMSIYQYTLDLEKENEKEKEKRPRFALAMTLSDYEAAVKTNALRDDTLYFLKPKLFAYTNPLGEEFSSVELYQKHKLEEANSNAQEQKVRQKFHHILPSANRDLEVSMLQKMGKNEFGSKFVNADQEIEDMANDPLGRCLQLQLFIRERMETNKYRELQVRRLILYKNGHCLVLVQGPGSHYCRIANRIHRHASIYFTVDRRTTSVRQHCYHGKCQSEGHERCFGVKMDSDLQALFAPQELLGFTKKRMVSKSGMNKNNNEDETDGGKESTQAVQSSPPLMHAGLPIQLSTPTRMLSLEQKEKAEKVIKRFPLYSQPMKSIPRQKLVTTKSTCPEEEKDRKENKPALIKNRPPRAILENVANTGMPINSVDNILFSDDDENDKPVGKIKETHHDMKETKEIKETDEKAEKRTTKIPDGVFDFDENGQIVFVPAKHKTERKEIETETQTTPLCSVSQYKDLF